MSGLPADRDRYLELLAAQALGDLSPEEGLELVELGDQFPDLGADEFERIAAAVTLALTPVGVEAMPAELRDKIERDAGPYLLREGNGKVDAKVQTWQPAVNRREVFAWLLVAASMLVAFLIGFDRNPKTPVALADQRSALMADERTITVAWQPGPTPFAGAVTGDVVWNPAEQRGFMRFVGMPTNNAKQQYQLWIIDASRTGPPVDGGVFDIDANGQVIVPIDAKLEVGSPAAFAITLEKRGGVVVSDQSNLPLLAPVAQEAANE